MDLMLDFGNKESYSVKIPTRLPCTAKGSMFYRSSVKEQVSELQLLSVISCRTSNPLVYSHSDLPGARSNVSVSGG